MSKGLIFFCCSCAILLFTIINLSVGPIISGKAGKDIDIISTNEFYWGTANCEYWKDQYDESQASGDVLKYGLEWYKDECIRKKAMHDMEYTSFIFNAVIGYVCATLGLLHLFDVKKEFVSKTGLIGLGCGIVGFVFSFVYVILNGLVYTTYYNHNNIIYKRDSDGVFAEKKGNDYECIYFDSEHNIHALIAKYSDLIQKQYNYDKDLIDSLAKINSACKSYSPNNCRSDGKISPTTPTPNCDKLYIDDYSSSSRSTGKVTNKDLSDRFLTTLLLSLFVCLANIGLAIFGFLLFRTPGEF
jgi:hypothetical protein